MLNFLQLHRTCESEIAYLRQQVLYLQSKCDRLTEALVKKEQQIVVRLPEAPQVPSPGTPIVVPQSVAATFPTEGPNVWAKGTGWFGEQTIATPREHKVSAP